MYENNLYAIRKKRHISQDRLADALGINRKTVRLIESGQTNPSLSMAYRIATYFEMLVTEIFPEDAYQKE